jgi:hypothetical protein
MKTLNKPIDNLGGLLKMWAIPSDQFLLSGYTISVGNTENIYQLYCSPDSMQLTSPSEKTIEGTVYNTTIKGLAPGITSALEGILKDMVSHKWVVITMDGNGSYVLCGTNYFPLDLNTSLNSGLDTPDRAGCEFIFSGKVPFAYKIVPNPF